MHAFNQSLRYDQRMHAADIRGSIAYAKALTRVGILTGEEEGKIVEGLQAVGREWESGQVRSGNSFFPLFRPRLSPESQTHLGSF
jgi:argininosuccinate lyase